MGFSDRFKKFKVSGMGGRNKSDGAVYNGKGTQPGSSNGLPTSTTSQSGPPQRTTESISLKRVPLPEEMKEAAEVTGLNDGEGNGSNGHVLENEGPNPTTDVSNTKIEGNEKSNAEANVENKNFEENKAPNTTENVGDTHTEKNEESDTADDISSKNVEKKDEMVPADSISSKHTKDEKESVDADNTSNKNIEANEKSKTTQARIEAEQKDGTNSTKGSTEMKLQGSEAVDDQATVQDQKDQEEETAATDGEWESEMPILNTSLQLAIVHTDYIKAAGHEIQLQKGQYVEEVDQFNDIWWFGVNAAGEKGLFPSENVALLPPTKKKRRQSIHVIGTIFPSLPPPPPPPPDVYYDVPPPPPDVYYDLPPPPPPPPPPPFIGDPYADIAMTLPSWFLDNCVTTFQDLQHKSILLRVIDPGDKVLKKSLGDKVGCCADRYEIDAIIYRALRRALSPLNVVEDALESDEVNTGNAKSTFRSELVYLRLPDHLKIDERPGSPFFSAIVETYAKEIEADVIRINSHDIRDLVAHFNKCLGSPEVDHLLMNSSFDIILGSPLMKPSSNSEHHFKRRRPLIIHISEIEGFFSPNIRVLAETESVLSPSDVSKPLPEKISENCEPSIPLFLEMAFQELLKSIHNDENADMMTVIVTSAVANSSNDSKITQSVLSRCEPILMFCAGPGLENRELALDTNSIRYYQGHNSRTLKRMIRSKVGATIPGIQPYAEWDFLSNLEKDVKYNRCILSHREISSIFEHLHGTLNSEAIQKAIMHDFEYEKALRTHREITNLQKGDLSEEQRYIIDTIENSGEEFAREKSFLGCVVKTGDDNHGWNDIKIDPEIKKALIQAIHRPDKDSGSNFGILKRANMGGALLYGPSGTGKTHLVRVLARETKKIMISISVADIENKWFGESPRAIKAIFSLAKMLAPSIIFFDEADALFRKRSADDPSTVRSQINQLLFEMDGLAKSDNRPFVILATNLPNGLDPAVLRRVPCRSFIGLPSKHEREAIFQIHLREEIIHERVDFSELAIFTAGCTGSDISTICYLTAVISDEAMETPGQKRTLKREHFIQAITRNRPSTSRDTLTQLKVFARENDPLALPKILAADEELVYWGHVQYYVTSYFLVACRLARIV
ncbi:hypothetical protein B0J11DRAFT_491800 [Dendryphion nanum]|uniref:SH3 domain-containing protein n=1 Tax=Dendryphion nanum TaxID=256645 RepID=A0A9P9IHJ7_9PLEO|nr:hypothetical protein B0J11DRAFT_491800 [Dendryphion nanum]